MHDVLIIERYPYVLCVDMFIWTDFPVWKVCKRWLTFKDVGMWKSISALLKIARALVFLPRGLPLIHFQRFIALAYCGCPTCPVMDNLGLFGDELMFPTPFVFLEKKRQVAKPQETTDFINVVNEAGVLVVLCPAFDDAVECHQSGVLIHPSPSSRSQVFQLCLDPFLRLLTRA